MNYLELCQQTCSSLLELEPENETACILMADIAFRKVDFEMAVFHFTQLIVKQPTNWSALVRFTEIMRRTGNLSDVLQYLQIAETQSNPKDAGKSIKNWFRKTLSWLFFITFLHLLAFILLFLNGRQLRNDPFK